MSDISRAEIDARLEANEARRDAMFNLIMGKLDMLIERLDAQIKRIDKLEQAMTSLKTTVIITGISSSLAIIFGVAGFNAMLLSNMTATFESGKDTATMQHETRRILLESDALIKKMQERLDKQAAHD
jgi:high-affinity nickel permease